MEEKKMTKKNKIKEKLKKNVPLSERELAKLSAPRNEVVRQINAQGGQTGAGTHKDKRWDAKYGKEKHKRKNFGYE